jgi:metal-responsive CopG/Arc/MetJ family transcriptional regulator
MDDDVSIDLRLPTGAMTRLDQIAARDGGSRSDVARRLLIAALADVDAAEQDRRLAGSFLDLDEDLAGP